MTLESKYIGLILAICSSFLIGASFVITKKGLQRASLASEGELPNQIRSMSCSVDDMEPAFASDSHLYLKSPVWWLGLAIMVCGEILNFIGTYAHRR